MRALLACLSLLVLAACADLRLTPEQAERINSVLIVVEPFDEVAVTTYWTEMEYYVSVYNRKTKRTEQVYSPHPVARSGGATLAANLTVRDQIRGVLGNRLGARYRVNLSDVRVPAIKDAFNPIGILVKGRSQLVAEALQQAIPPGTADAILVVRGPAATFDYRFGFDPYERKTTNNGYVAGAYNLYLIDGTRFEVLASVHARARVPATLPPPHGYRLAVQRHSDEDLGRLREVLLPVIEPALDAQLRRLGLLPMPGEA